MDARITRRWLVMFVCLMMVAALIGASEIHLAIRNARNHAAYDREMFLCLMDRRDEDTTFTVNDAYRACVIPLLGVVHRAEDIRVLARRYVKEEATDER